MGINVLFGIVRTKFAAVFIGTAGVGLVTSFLAIQNVIGILAGLGIQSSAVREIAAAVGKQDKQAIGRAVLSLRRVCLLTGLAGMLLTIALSSWINRYTFGSGEYSFDIAALGAIVLLGNISGGQIALIQGARRIGDIARINVYGGFFATIAAICFYSWLGLRGVLPALVTIALMQLAVSWYFARRVPVPKVLMNWGETFYEARDMIKLGLVLMWNSLLLSAVNYITITLISQKISLESVGIYSAALALSGIFVNFVLKAMGADFYPRLTGLANDKEAVNRLVNEQTEIGLLLGLPGLLAMMTLAPLIIRICYTAEFLPAVELLEWFSLGCVGSIISWPMGYIMLALGKGRWFFLTETLFNLAHILFIALGLQTFGLKGIGVAFILVHSLYVIALYVLVGYLTGFSWTHQTKKIIQFSLFGVVLTFLIAINLSFWPTIIMGGILTALTCIYSLRGFIKRLGSDHLITRVTYKVPGLRALCEF